MKYLAISMLVMAAVTYIIRALPLSIFKHEVKSNFVKSFLAYIPYAVLSAMTIPAIFSSTSSEVSACIGLAAAVAIAYFDVGLLPTALGAAAAVFVSELII